jgi:protoporphyrinogen/coproporphyrinogen III oxidase
MTTSVKSVAILGTSLLSLTINIGGGISGLASAWHLSKLLPQKIPITLFESQRRIGGWMNSVRIQRPGGSVLFETGPHTLRPSALGGFAGLELIQQIGLDKDILWVNKDSLGAKNRYIKYQGRLVLIRPPKRLLPDSYFFTEPLLRKAIGGVLKFGLFRPRRPAGSEDESIASFFRRRFNEHIAQYFVSALVHGVYAGDYERLSMRSSLFKVFWDMETAGKRFMQRPAEEEVVLNEMKAGLGENLVNIAKDSRMYSFPDGTDTLSRRLREKLEGKVTIRTDSPIQRIKKKGQDIIIRTPLQSQAFSHVISTIPLPSLFQVLPSPPVDLINSFPPSVTVAVVNLYYPRDSVTLPIRGFGYLIPQTTSEENPEDALGVIIVTDGVQGQDTGIYKDGIKLTVMLGGHYWRERTSYPSEDELLSAAKSVIARDLAITTNPTIYLVSLQRNCIPQYEIGHHERMQKLEGYLESTFGQDRFKIVGSAVDGVGVNDCILSTRKMAKRMQELAFLEDIFE